MSFLYKIRNKILCRRIVSYFESSIQYSLSSRQSNMAELYLLNLDNRSEWQNIPEFQDMIEEMGFKKISNWACASLRYGSSDDCRNTLRRCIKHDLMSYSKAWARLSDKEAEERYHKIMENRTDSELGSIPKRWKLNGRKYIPPSVRSGSDWTCRSLLENCIRVGRACIYHELKIYSEQWNAMSSDQRSDYRKKLSLGRGSKEMMSVPTRWRKFLLLVSSADVDPQIIGLPVSSADVYPEMIGLSCATNTAREEDQ